MYSGKILVAKPVIKDEVFARKAIFILMHSTEEGANGFIMNSKKIGKMMVTKNDPNIMKFLENSESPTLDDLVKNTKQVDIYSGGPYNSIYGMAEGIYMISNAKFGDEITKGIYFCLGKSIDYVKFFASKKKSKIYTGISRWAPGQLEKEIEDGAWDVIDDINPEWFFNSEMVEEFFQAKIFFPKSSYGYTPSLN